MYPSLSIRTKKNIKYIFNQKHSLLGDSPSFFEFNFLNTNSVYYPNFSINAIIDFFFVKSSLLITFYFFLKSFNKLFNKFEPYFIVSLYYASFRFYSSIFLFKISTYFFNYPIPESICDYYFIYD